MILFISYCFQGVNISKCVFLGAACHDSLYFLLFQGVNISISMCCLGQHVMILFISYYFQGVNISKYVFLGAACHDSFHFLLFSGCKHL